MLTQNALQAEIGSSGPIFIAIAIFFFAFSSIIGNYYYGETNLRFLTSNKTALQLYRIASGGLLVLFGAMASLDLVWNIGDLCMALITMCNLVALTKLCKYVFRLLNDYRQQKKAGIKEPQFHKHILPDIANDIDCWDE